MDSYTFEILSEKVSESDIFEDKTHEYAADNLKRVIESSRSSVTIGLEGGWGSGKSTVVNLLRKKLSKTGDNNFFYLFDAWAHDGDPLRRIFLEGLIDRLDPDSQDEYLSNLRGEISGQKKRVEVKSKRSASKLGGFLSLSAIFVPLGAALLSAIDYSTVGWFSSGLNVHWPFLCGLFFTLTPLWTLVVWAVFSSDDPAKKSKSWIFKKKWDVFEADSEEEYSQDIIENGERTSIEFERFFGQIMDHIIGADSKYSRAIIVIDNLDRIEPEQTLAMWSILQTFFQYRSYGEDEGSTWRDKLWFLIPYDREGLSKVWQGTNAVAKGDRESSDTLLGQERWSSDLGDNSVACSFLEKCFQLIEEVPEPVLSSWMEYCKYKTDEALVGWPEDSRSIVVDTYQRYESSLTRSPSPRQVQAFINKVGMLGLRWGSRVSPEAIALYALARGNRSERQLREELLKPGLPNGYKTTNDAGVKSELAGLLFGVDKHKGMQLLLEPEITDALASGSGEKVSELIKDHGEGFWIVWNSIKAKALPNGHVEEYRISFTKAFCIGTQAYPERVSQDIAILEQEWKSQDDKWELDKYDYREPLEALVSTLRGHEGAFSDWLKKKVAKEVLQVVKSASAEDVNQDVLYGVRRLIDYLHSIGKRFQAFHYSSLDREAWGTWLSTLESANLDFPEVLPDNKVMPALIETIDPTNAGGDNLETITRTLAIDKQNSYFEAMLPRLIAWMVNPNRTLGLDVAYELIVMCYGRLKEDGRKQIVAALNDPNSVQRTSQESAGELPSLIALYALVYKRRILGENIPKNIVSIFHNEPNGEFMEKVISILEENDEMSSIWDMASSSKNKFSIYALRNTEVDRIYAVDDGAYLIDEYEWLTEEETGSMVNELISRNVFIRAVHDYIDDPIQYSRCLHILAEYGGDNSKLVIDEVSNEISQNSWEKLFEIDTRLVGHMTSKGNHKFKDAVLNFGKNDLVNEKGLAKFWDSFSVIYDHLPDQDAVTENLLVEYFTHNVDPLGDLSFKQFVGCVQSDAIERLQPSLVMARVELWISRGQWERLEWLVKQNLNPPETVSESLTSRLESAIAESKEHQEVIERVASVYGIDLLESQAENEEIAVERE